MAIKPLNSVGGFSVGLPANTVIDGGGNITAAKANLVGNLSAGAGNLAFNSATNILTVLGNIVSTNANLGNAVTANFFTGTLTTSSQPNITSVGTLTGLTVNGKTALGSIGNVSITGGQANYVMATDGQGNLSFVSPSVAAGLAGSNTQVQFNDNGVFGASSDFTFNKSSNTLSATLFTGTLTTNAQTNVTSVGVLTSVSVAGTATVGNVSTLGNVSAGGTVAGAFIIGDGSNLSNITGANVTSQVGNALVAGTVYTAAQPNITLVGTLTSVSVSGNAVVGNLSTVGTVFATGNGSFSNVSAILGAFTNVSGNGSLLTGITGANVTGQVGNALVAGTVYSNAQPNITSVGTLTSVSVSGNAEVGNLSTVGTVLATLGAFTNVSGNGSALSSITGANVTGQVGNALVAGTVYSNAQPNITSVGALTSLSVVGIATVGNVLTGGFVSATGNVTGGNLSTAGAVSAGTLTVSGVSSLGNVGNVGITGGTAGQYLRTDGAGNLSFATIGTSGIANGTSNVDIPVSGGNVNTSVGGVANVFVVTSTGANVAGTLGVSGNANVGNLGTTGVFAATLSASGNADVGNVNAGNMSASGNITVGSGTGGTISGANLVSANYFTGTLTTAAQPNITSVGALTSLSVVGNANVGNLGTTGVFAATLSASGNANVGNIGAGVGSFSAGVTAANLTSNNLTNTRVTFTSGGVLSDASSFTFATGNGLVSATAFSGNGTLLTNVAANTAVTVTANAQPNITSVGSLTSLSVIGNAAVGNLSTVGEVSATGNGTFGNVATTGLMTAGNVTTSGSVSAGSVSATGNVTGGNLSTAGAVTSATLGVSGNAAVGNLSTGGVITATGNITSNSTVVTDFIAARTGSLEIAATGANASINLKPTGTGSVDVNSAKITNLGTPTAATDAATKDYVDTVAQGLAVKAAVFVATTGALTATYNNGASGVGATLTGTGTLTVDGQTISTIGARVLVKNQGTAPYYGSVQNGIYTLTTANPFVLTRSLDMNVPAEFASAFTFVTTGTTNADTGWVQTAEVVTIGTDPVVFTQFSGAGQYSAGAGLLLTGTTFSVVTDGSTTEVNGNNQVSVKASAQLVTPNIGAATGTSISVSGNVVAANFMGNLANGTSSVSIPAANGNVNIVSNGNTTLVVTPTGANIAGNLSVSGNITGANISGNISGNLSGNITIPGASTQVVYVDANGFANSSAAFTFNSGSNLVTVSSVLAVTANTKITGATVTTSSVTPAVVATFPVASVTGVEYIVKGVGTAGNAYSMATVQAITNGTAVDYSVYGTLALGAATYSDLTVVINGSNIELQVTPGSVNSTVWTTQYRLI